MTVANVQAQHPLALCGPRMHERIAAIAATMLLMLALGTSATAQSVTADYSQPVSNVTSMVGFLDCLSSAVPDSLIDPLQPQLWRFGANWYPNSGRVSGKGIEQIFISNASYSGGHNAPQDTTLLTSPYYKEITNQSYWLRNKAYQFDVWNEPDVGGAGQDFVGSEQQYFDTFRCAVAAVRAEYASRRATPVIIGPSCGFSQRAGTNQWGITTHQFMLDFMRYCKNNNIKVDILAWHEFSDDNIQAIQSDISWVEANIFDNTYYDSVDGGSANQKIEIPEIIGRTDESKPAEILAYLCTLEQAEIRPVGACKGYWASSDNDQYNPTLDGLITSTQQPRSAWWAYKSYADSVATRFNSSVDNPTLVSFASTSGQMAQVVIGYFVNTSQVNPPATLPVTLHLQNLTSLSFVGNSSHISVTVQSIPDTETGALPSLTTVYSGSVPVSSGSASLTLSPLGLHGAYLVTFN